MEIIDRMLARIEFQTNTQWIECYLHESNLITPPFVVVERHGKADTGFVMSEFDTQEEAQAAYDAAAVRVKAAIAEALKAI